MFNFQNLHVWLEEEKEEEKHQSLEWFEIMDDF